MTTDSENTGRPLRLRSPHEKSSTAPRECRQVFGLWSRFVAGVRESDLTFTACNRKSAVGQCHVDHENVGGWWYSPLLFGQEGGPGQVVRFRRGQ